jgi:hypothetical protein
VKFPVPSASSDIPQGDHPGAFGARRKHHIHEGVDIYAPHASCVYAITNGVIISAYQFTGKLVGMPWWNDTWAIAVADDTGIWVYGEVYSPCYRIGDHVKEGQCIALVEQVLKIDKGRPLSMLHLERWKPFTSPHTFLWQLNQPQPDFLLDPTPLLLEMK